MHERAQVSLRYETSKKIEEAPKTQMGMNVSWLPLDHLQLSAEYLRSKYQNNPFAEENQTLDTDSTIALRMTYEF